MIEAPRNLRPLALVARLFHGMQQAAAVSGSVRLYVKQGGAVSTVRAEYALLLGERSLHEVLATLPAQVSSEGNAEIDIPYTAHGDPLYVTVRTYSAPPR